MSKDTSHSWKAWLLVSVILLLVVAGAVILLRILPAGSSHSHSANNQISSISTANRGVKLEISYNGGSATCYYQQASFYLKEGESLHPQVPSGEFTVALHVPIAPGKLRTARVGATFSGCAVTVLRDEKILIYRKEAEEERITVFSDAMAIASRNAVVTYVIESNGGPIRFRALWQPLGATASFLLPAANENWSSSDQLSEGLSIIQKLNCVSCHKSSDPKLNQLLKGGACPDLSIAASKLNHDWMVKWITDPAKTKTDSTMPMVLKAGTTKDTVEDIIHYLKSIGEDTQTNSTIEIDDALIQSGMMYYHKIGCVACHGPMDKELELEGSYRKLPDLSQKFTVEHLSAFLFDPVKWRPDGRMPSLKLNNQEATAIAAYLLSEGISKTVVENDLTDPERIERGEAAFVQNLCYQCHETGSTLTSTVTQDSTFTPFESLVNNLDAGCLSDDNSKHSVRYNLSDEVKLAIRDFIKNTSDSTVTNVKMLSLAATIKRLNCTACHSWGGKAGPEDAIADYFQVTRIENAALEDRLPPSLDDVGAKLKDKWMHEVLEDGKSVRNYLLTRMPQYGISNVIDFPDQLVSEAGIKQDNNSEAGNTPIDSNKLRTGQALVGNEGLDCLSCHDFAGKPATVTAGLDLVTTGERLRLDYFTSWLRIPHELSPGTRMPSFFIGVSSPIEEYYEGDPQRQIEAIYAYLSNSGDESILEETDSKPQYQLSVTDEPIVFRTFMNNGKSRVTVCGYPEQIHCAFDMTNSHLLHFWEGEFIDNNGNWENPSGINSLWQSPPGPTFFSQSRLYDNWQVSALSDIQFKGMKLDSDRKPIFLYNLKLTDSVINIQEQPIPVRNNGSISLRRRFILTGQPGEIVYFNSGKCRIISESEETGNSIKHLENNLIQLVLDRVGITEFDVEVSK